MSKIRKKIYFLQKKLHRIQKVKKTDPPKNHPKNWPAWQSQVISAIFKGVMAIFLNYWIMGISINEKKTCRTLMVPDWRLEGKGHPWHKKSSWETQKKSLWKFGWNIFIWLKYKSWKTTLEQIGLNQSPWNNCELIPLVFFILTSFEKII